MTKSEMDYVDSVLIGPMLLLFNQYFNVLFDEYIVLIVAMVSRMYSICIFLTNFLYYYYLYTQIYTFADMSYYATNVCREIATFLNIYVFSIKARPSRPQSAKLESTKKGNQNGRERRYDLRRQKA